MNAWDPCTLHVIPVPVLRYTRLSRLVILLVMLLVMQIGRSHDTGIHSYFSQSIIVQLYGTGISGITGI